MTLHEGENLVDGLAVMVVRRRARRIILRVKADGSVWVTVPLRGGTLKAAAAFLAEKWDWMLRTRWRVLARPAAPPAPAATPFDILSLQALLDALMGNWAARLGEADVTWKIRDMKTRWGVCNYVRRRVTYATQLALKPRELVEYVVVHELTHLRAHGHGPAFQALMDARLPGWRALRRRLNAR